MEIQLRLEWRNPGGGLAVAPSRGCTDPLAVSVPRPTVTAVFVADDRVIYSASDLAAAARCEYALLRAFDAKLGRGAAVSVEDALLARTATLGDEHEHRHLDDLRDRPTAMSPSSAGRFPVHRREPDGGGRRNHQAVDTRTPLIYQAAMFDGRFVGFADFLILDGERYRVSDTKLARSAKVEALLQLAAYADALTDGRRAGRRRGRTDAAATAR